MLLDLEVSGNLGPWAAEALDVLCFLEPGFAQVLQSRLGPFFLMSWCCSRVFNVSRVLLAS